jgi:hypothetical protein|uniref:Uncharacterized protein n=1 Tax=Picea glauca TaxID=3330 RepID=A0A101M5C5_PICGL|nr:hypothetical protein ABT39_MTgene966 [Picea glauca]QHR91147.1 hypothetical protein Q903MT_gene5179 [Picea sitchensis]
MGIGFGTTRREAGKKRDPRRGNGSLIGRDATFAPVAVFTVAFVAGETASTSPFTKLCNQIYCEEYCNWSAAQLEVSPSKRQVNFALISYYE